VVKKSINRIYLGGKMNYTQVIIAYDIADNKKRIKFYETLKDFGLLPIQKSVFWGYILPSERKSIISIYKEFCDIKSDNVIMVNAALEQNIQDCFGYTKEFFRKPDDFDII